MFDANAFSRRRNGFSPMVRERKTLAVITIGRAAEAVSTHKRPNLSL
jgi:hypothetical protein